MPDDIRRAFRHCTSITHNAGIQANVLELKTIVLVAAGIFGSASLAAQAQSSVTLYGVIDAGISYVNHSNLNSAGANSLLKFDDGVAQGNRWGSAGLVT